MCSLRLLAKVHHRQSTKYRTSQFNVVSERRPVAACRWSFPSPFTSWTRGSRACPRALLSLIEDVYGATAPAFDAPPVSNALPMKLAETLQPAHLLTRLEFFHTDRAFLLAPVAVHAVFFGGDVREDATRAVRHGASPSVGCSVGCGRGAERRWQIGIVWVRRWNGTQIRRGCWLRGWSREPAANAGLDVCFADCIAWRHFDTADRTLVFLFDLTTTRYRGVWGG